MEQAVSGQQQQGSSQYVHTKFTTPLPRIASEKENRTVLFSAYEILLTKVQGWCTQFAASNQTLIDPQPAGGDVILIPSWLSVEVEAFFDVHLASAIQERECRLVNTMHECFQQELKAKTERVTSLTLKLSMLEKETTQLQSKLDRRIEENNLLRKDYYKQLLVLNDLVNKSKSDPRTIKALDEAIASVTLGKEKAAALVTSSSNELDRKSNVDFTGAIRKERDKWELRARETKSECDHLQQQILLLNQQLEESREMEGPLWFLTAQSGLQERQRIIDSVYKSKCTWESVGEAIIELLNNNTIWSAVESSAHREKSRASRGLEALLIRSIQFDDTSGIDSEEPKDDVIDNAPFPVGPGNGSNQNRRLSLTQAARWVACRMCNGCGYLDSNADGSTVQDEESYLRKTLGQVLELKSALESANNRVSVVESELQRTVLEGIQMKQRIEDIDSIRSNAVDSNLQVDLDEEEEVNLDEIMDMYHHPDHLNSTLSKRGGARFKQYENLIVELKSALTERDAALTDARKTVSEIQARLLDMQRVSQKDQETYRQETLALKTSLTLAMKDRNHVIVEKQAAIKLVLQKFELKRTRKVLEKDSIVENESKDTDKSSVDNEESLDQFLDATSKIEDEDEVKRSEVIARRYSQAIGRVQVEYNEQQRLLQEAEDTFGQSTDPKKRTNSIVLGSINVNMSSHPRDIYKALTSTQNELLGLRRATQKASTLQTDRLLTLTTHLAHISEELSMVRKRASTEIEYWKLECEKLQNDNKMMSVEFQNTQQRLQHALEKLNEKRSSTSIPLCTICENHQGRLMAISTQLIQDSLHGETTDKGKLTDLDHKHLCTLLVELEELYSTFTKAKQLETKKLLTKALVGQDYGGRLSSNSQFGDIDKMRRTSTAAIAVDERLFTYSNMNPEPTVRRNVQQSVVSTPSIGLLSEGGIQIKDGSPRHRKKTLVSNIVPHRNSKARPSLHSQASVQVNERESVFTSNKGIQDVSVHEGGTEHLMHDAKVEPNITDNAKVASGDIPSSTVTINDVPLHVPESVSTSTMDQTRSSDTTHTQTDGQLFEKTFDNVAVQTTVTSYTGPLVLSALSLSSSIQPEWQTDDSKHFEHDPVVFMQLQPLVKAHSTAREALALTNWTILLCHMRVLRDHQRLNWLNDALKHIEDDRSVSTISVSLRSTMEKLVQHRENFLDAIIHGRAEIQANMRRVQAQLMQTLTFILVSQKSNETTSLSAVSTISRSETGHRIASPKPDPPFTFNTTDGEIESGISQNQGLQNSAITYHSNRPLYPVVSVNMSQVPSFSQIATPSFPFSNVGYRYPPSSHHIELTMRASPTKKFRLNVPEFSLFKQDNRFPQRFVKYSLTGDSYDTSPTGQRSPAKILNGNEHHRSTRTASSFGDPILNIHRSMESLSPSYYQPPEMHTTTIQKKPQRPVRPQSSPAGMRTARRVREPHEYDETLEITTKAETVKSSDMAREPEYSSKTVNQAIAARRLARWGIS